MSNYFKHIKSSNESADIFTIRTDYSSLDNQPFLYDDENNKIQLYKDSIIELSTTSNDQSAQSSDQSTQENSQAIPLFNGKTHNAVLGNNNTINATNSLIVGTNNTIGQIDAEALSSAFAAGSYLTLKNSNTAAVGTYNAHTAKLSAEQTTESPNYCFMVGNGSDTEGEKNALAVGNGFIDIGGTDLKDGATVGRITAKTAQELYLKKLTLHKLTLEAKSSESTSAPAVIDTDESNTGGTNTAAFTLDPQEGLMMSYGDSALKISIKEGLSFTASDGAGGGCSITPNGLSIGGVSFIEKDTTNSITNGSVTISGNTITFSAEGSNTGTIQFGNKPFTAADLVKSEYVGVDGGIGCPDGINWETIVIYTKTTVNNVLAYNSMTVPKAMLGSTASKWRDSSGIVYELTLTNTADGKGSITIVPSGGEPIGATFF